MKTIKQQAEVLFQSLDFTDKVMILPIMDKLAESIKNNTNLRISADNSFISIPLETAKKIFKILNDLDCCTSLGENYKDIIKSDNSQKEENKKNKEEQNNRCILQLFKPSTNKLEIIKIIKEELHIGLKEAKDLVDFCPVDIDLSQYEIKQSEYERLFYLLKQKGCICNLITKEQ